jgi:hypothetical protein
VTEQCFVADARLCSEHSCGSCLYTTKDLSIYGDWPTSLSHREIYWLKDRNTSTEFSLTCNVPYCNSQEKQVEIRFLYTIKFDLQALLPEPIVPNIALIISTSEIPSTAAILYHNLMITWSNLFTVADLGGVRWVRSLPFRKKIVHIFQRKRSKNGSISPLTDFELHYLTWVAPIPHRIVSIHKNSRSATD